MSYYLTPQAALKQLETPMVYQIARDELFELDAESFRFLSQCGSGGGCTSKDSAFIDYCVEEGLLTTEPYSVARPSLVQAPSPSLRYLELQITTRCNLRCGHCYLGETEPRDLSLPLLQTALSEFEALQGLRVLITGGEPLLHPQFGEINELLPDLFVRKVLFTNGAALTRQALAGLKVNEIQVSIDGLQPAHDALRGRGSFDSAMTAARRALDAGFEVSVATMVHRGNLGDFDEMERLLKTMGVREWSVDAPCAAGRMEGNADLAVSPEEGGKFLGYGYGGGMHSSGHGFACGLHLMAVLADGSAAKCTFYGHRPVGRIEDGLRVCWERIKPLRLESLDCRCEFLDICRGGCRYRAERLDHRLGKDLYRCSLYGVLDGL